MTKHKKKIIPSIRKVVAFLVCRIVPPRPGLIVFAQSRRRYSDNSRALFEWMYQAGYDVRWLYQDVPPEAPEIPKELFISRQSWRGIATAIRANVAVVSFSPGDFGSLASVVRHRKVVMLWHGIGIKHLGVLDAKATPERARQETRCFDLVTASSAIDRYYNAAHGHVPVENVAITGLPRNDRLLEMAARDNGRKTADGQPTVILYAPTFRDYAIECESLFFPFADHDESRLTDELRRLEIRIVLRPHSDDRRSMHHGMRLAASHPDIFTFSDAGEATDTAALIVESDAVISDYSSIYLDFVLLDRPCLFIPWDRERYQETRGIAYDYELITPGPKVLTQKDFLDAVRTIASQDPAWSERRAMVRKMFHHYSDGNSCARVAAAIEGLLAR